MKHLYVIGNGFDKHHEIKSSYKDFRSWMELEHPEELYEFEEAYGYCDDDWWSDFENNLASLDILTYADNIAAENPPDLASDHCDRTWNDAEIYVEQELEKLYSDIKYCFHDWIMQLNKPLPEKRIMLLIKDSIFLSFNYTKTLEEFYKVSPSKVLHIHGCIDDDEEFIIGHGKDIKQLEAMNPTNDPEPPDDLDDVDMEAWEEEQADRHQFHEQLAEEAAFRGVESQRKPVTELIKKHKAFFDSLEGIADVYVYGSSLSDVDLPYFEKIASVLKDVPWEFSDYDGDNKERIEWFAKNYGIKEYIILTLDELIYTPTT